MVMAGQSIFCRALLLLNNGNKMILTNRINLMNFTPTCKKGLKQETKDFKKYEVPEKPKRPLTSFFTFLSEKRPILVKENPALSSQEIVKKLSEEWKFLSIEAKQKYEEQSKQNKAIYDKKILDYAERLTPEQEVIIKELEKEKHKDKMQRKIRKESRNEHKPKRPATTFCIFVRDSNKQKHKRGEKSVTEFMKDLKDEWAKMTDEEKNKYVIEYNKNKQQYEKELTAWEAKMIAQGKEKLVRTITLKKYFPKEKSTKNMDSE